MASIRVDQSHCNYHLARWLREQGWEILFTDAGRVTRGGMGAQGASLRVFEEGGLPIPDIIACRKGTLLFVEIDNDFAKAEASLIAYGEVEAFLLDAFTAISELRQGPLAELVLAFCRTGTVADIDEYLDTMREEHPAIDGWAAFRAAGEPATSGF